MLTHTPAHDEIKQQYHNSHLFYAAYKAGILMNELGIISAIKFYDKDYVASHPKIEHYKKPDAPDEDKSVGDTRLLLPLKKIFSGNIPSSIRIRSSVMLLLTASRSIKHYFPAILSVICHMVLLGSLTRPILH